MILFLATLGINYAGGTGLINGMSQGDVSDRYQTLITPASMAFSIWSVIYTFLAVSLVVMLVKHREGYYKEAVDSISVLFWITCALNMGWIVTFSYLQLGISTLFIFAFVLTLSLILVRLWRINDGKRWLLPVTFGMYTGWLFIATVVNVAAFLNQLGWNGFGLSEEWWTIAILIVAVVLAGWVLTRVKNAVFTLPIAWGYWGIYQALQGKDVSQGVEWTALIGIIPLVALAAYAFYRYRFAVMPAKSR